MTRLSSAESAYDSATLTNSGIATLVAIETHLMLTGAIRSPAPIIEPTMACVVDTGNLLRVARPTQKTAPASTATAKVGSGGTATMPFVKTVLIFAAKVRDKSEPARVVTTPQAMAVRYRATPAPARVATPLASSLEPFAAARAVVRISSATRSGGIVIAQPNLDCAMTPPL